MAKDLVNPTVSLVAEKGSVYLVSSTEQNKVRLASVLLDGEVLDGVYAETQKDGLATLSGECAAVTSLEAGALNRDAMIRKWMDARNQARLAKAGGATLLVLSLAACHGEGGLITEITEPTYKITDTGATIAITSATEGATITVVSDTDGEDWYDDVTINADGSGTLTLSFEDADDVVVLSAESTVTGFDTIVVEHGTVDFSFLDFDGEILVGSTAMISYNQFMAIPVLALRPGAESGTVVVTVFSVEQAITVQGASGKVEEGVELIIRVAGSVTIPELQQLLDAGIPLEDINFSLDLTESAPLVVPTATTADAIVNLLSLGIELDDLTFELADSVDNLVELANAILNGATGVIVLGAVSLADIQALLDMGVTLDRLSFTLTDTAENLAATDPAILAAADGLAIEGPISVADLQTLLDAGIELDGLAYTLEDTPENILAAPAAIVSGASAYVLTSPATVAQIEALLDAGAEIGDVSFELSDSIENIEAALPSLIAQSAGMTISGTPTVEQIEALLEAGAALEDLTFDLSATSGAFDGSNPLVESILAQANSVSVDVDTEGLGTAEIKALISQIMNSGVDPIDFVVDGDAEAVSILNALESLNSLASNNAPALSITGANGATMEVTNEVIQDAKMMFLVDSLQADLEGLNGASWTDEDYTTIKALSDAIKAVQAGNSSNVDAIEEATTVLTQAISALTDAVAQDVADLTAELEANADATATNAQAISGLVDTLTSLQGLVNDNNDEQAAALQGVQDTLSAAIDDLSNAVTEQVAALFDSITDNSTDILTNATAIGGLVDSVAALQSALDDNADQQSAALDALETALSTAIDELAADIADQVADQVADLEASIGDNATDIATNAVAISALNTSVAALQELVNDQNTAQTEALDAVETALNTAIQNVSDALSAAILDIDANADDIAANATEIANLQTALNELTALVGDNNDSLLQALDDMQGAMNLQIGNLTDQINADLADLQSQITANDGDIATNISDIADLFDAVAALELSLGGSNSDTASALTALEDNLNSAVTAVSDALDDAIANVETNAASIASAATLISSLQTSLSDLSTLVGSNNTTLQESITDLQSAIEQQITDLSDQLGADIADLQAQITANDGDIATNIADIADLYDALSALQSTVSDLDSGATTSLAALETALNDAISAVADDLTAAVTSLTTDIEANADAILTNASDIVTLNDTLATLQDLVDANDLAQSDALSSLETTLLDLAAAMEAELDTRITTLEDAMSALLLDIENATIDNIADLSAAISALMNDAITDVNDANYTDGQPTIDSIAGLQAAILAIQTGGNPALESLIDSVGAPANPDAVEGDADFEPTGIFLTLASLAEQLAAIQAVIEPEAIQGTELGDFIQLYPYGGQTQTIRVDAGEGADTVNSANVNTQIIGGEGADQINLTWRDTSIDTVVYQSIFDGQTLPTVELTFSTLESDYREGTVLSLTINGDVYSYTITSSNGETVEEALNNLLSALYNQNAPIETGAVDVANGKLVLVGNGEFTVSAGAGADAAIVNAGRAMESTVTFSSDPADWPTLTNAGRTTEFDRQISVTIGQSTPTVYEVFLTDGVSDATELNTVDGVRYSTNLVIGNVTHNVTVMADGSLVDHGSNVVELNAAATVGELLDELNIAFEGVASFSIGLNGNIEIDVRYPHVLTNTDDEYVTEAVMTPFVLNDDDGALTTTDDVTIAGNLVQSGVEEINEGFLTTQQISVDVVYDLNGDVDIDASLAALADEITTQNASGGSIEGMLASVTVENTSLLFVGYGTGDDSRFVITEAAIEQNGTQQESVISFSADAADYYEGGALSVLIEGNLISADMVAGDPAASVAALKAAVEAANSYVTESVTIATGVNLLGSDPFSGGGASGGANISVNGEVWRPDVATAVSSMSFDYSYATSVTWNGSAWTAVDGSGTAIDVATSGSITRNGLTPWTYTSVGYNGGSFVSWNYSAYNGTAEQAQINGLSMSGSKNFQGMWTDGNVTGMIVREDSMGTYILFTDGPTNLTNGADATTSWTQGSYSNDGSVPDVTTVDNLPVFNDGATLDDLIAHFNTQFAGVATMAFDELNQELTITADVAGAGTTISVQDFEFLLNSGGDIALTDAVAVHVDGADRVLTLETVEANSDTELNFVASTEQEDQLNVEGSQTYAGEKQTATFHLDVAQTYDEYSYDIDTNGDQTPDTPNRAPDVYFEGGKVYLTVTDAEGNNAVTIEQDMVTQAVYEVALDGTGTTSLSSGQQTAWNALDETDTYAAGDISLVLRSSTANAAPFAYSYATGVTWNGTAWVTTTASQAVTGTVTANYNDGSLQFTGSVGNGIQTVDGTTGTWSSRYPLANDGISWTVTSSTTVPGLVTSASNRKFEGAWADMSTGATGMIIWQDASNKYILVTDSDPALASGTNVTDRWYGEIGVSGSGTFSLLPGILETFTSNAGETIGDFLTRVAADSTYIDDYRINAVPGAEGKVVLELNDANTPPVEVRFSVSGLHNLIKYAPVLNDDLGDLTSKALIETINTQIQNDPALAALIDGASYDTTTGEVVLTAHNFGTQTFQISDVTMDYAGAKQIATIELEDALIYSVNSDGVNMSGNGADVYFENGMVKVQISSFDGEDTWTLDVPMEWNIGYEFNLDMDYYAQNDPSLLINWTQRQSTDVLAGDEMTLSIVGQYFTSNDGETVAQFFDRIQTNLDLISEIVINDDAVADGKIIIRYDQNMLDTYFPGGFDAYNDGIIFQDNSWMPVGYAYRATLNDDLSGRTSEAIVTAINTLTTDDPTFGALVEGASYDSDTGQITITSKETGADLFKVTSVAMDYQGKTQTAEVTLDSDSVHVWSYIDGSTVGDFSYQRGAATYFQGGKAYLTITDLDTQQDIEISVDMQPQRSVLVLTDTNWGSLMDPSYVLDERSGISLVTYSGNSYYNGVPGTYDNTAHPLVGTTIQGWMDLIAALDFIESVTLSDDGSTLTIVAVEGEEFTNATSAIVGNDPAGLLYGYSPATTGGPDATAQALADEINAQAQPGGLLEGLISGATSSGTTVTLESVASVENAFRVSDITLDYVGVNQIATATFSTENGDYYQGGEVSIVVDATPADSTDSVDNLTLTVEMVDDDAAGSLQAILSALNDAIANDPAWTAVLSGVSLDMDTGEFTLISKDKVIHQFSIADAITSEREAFQTATATYSTNDADYFDGGSVSMVLNGQTITVAMVAGDAAATLESLRAEIADQITVEPSLSAALSTTVTLSSGVITITAAQAIDGYGEIDISEVSTSIAAQAQVTKLEIVDGGAPVTIAGVESQPQLSIEINGTTIYAQAGATTEASVQNLAQAIIDARDGVHATVGTDATIETGPAEMRIALPDGVTLETLLINDGVSFNSDAFINLGLPDDVSVFITGGDFATLLGADNQATLQDLVDEIQSQMGGVATISFDADTTELVITTTATGGDAFINANEFTLSGFFENVELAAADVTTAVTDNIDVIGTAGQLSLLNVNGVAMINPDGSDINLVQDGQGFNLSLTLTGGSAPVFTTANFGTTSLPLSVGMSIAAGTAGTNPPTVTLFTTINGGTSWQSEVINTPFTTSQAIAKLDSLVDQRVASVLGSNYANYISVTIDGTNLSINTINLAPAMVQVGIDADVTGSDFILAGETVSYNIAFTNSNVRTFSGTYTATADTTLAELATILNDRLTTFENTYENSMATITFDAVANAFKITSTTTDETAITINSFSLPAIYDADRNELAGDVTSVVQNGFNQIVLDAVDDLALTTPLAMETITGTITIDGTPLEIEFVPEMAVDGYGTGSTVEDFLTYLESFTEIASATIVDGNIVIEAADSAAVLTVDLSISVQTADYVEQGYNAGAGADAGTAEIAFEAAEAAVLEIALSNVDGATEFQGYSISLKVDSDGEGLVSYTATATPGFVGTIDDIVTALNAAGGTFDGIATFAWTGTNLEVTSVATGDVATIDFTSAVLVVDQSTFDFRVGAAVEDPVHGADEVAFVAATSASVLLDGFQGLDGASPLAMGDYDFSVQVNGSDISGTYSAPSPDDLVPGTVADFVAALNTAMTGVATATLTSAGLVITTDVAGADQSIDVTDAAISLTVVRAPIAEIASVVGSVDFSVDTVDGVDVSSITLTGSNTGPDQMGVQNYSFEAENADAGEAQAVQLQFTNTLDSTSTVAVGSIFSVTIDGVLTEMKLANDDGSSDVSGYTGHYFNLSTVVGDRSEAIVSGLADLIRADHNLVGSDGVDTDLGIVTVSGNSITLTAGSNGLELLGTVESGDLELTVTNAASTQISVGFLEVTANGAIAYAAVDPIDPETASLSEVQDGRNEGLLTFVDTVDVDGMGTGGATSTEDYVLTIDGSTYEGDITNLFGQVDIDDTATLGDDTDYSSVSYANPDSGWDTTITTMPATFSYQFDGGLTGSTVFIDGSGSRLQVTNGDSTYTAYSTEGDLAAMVAALAGASFVESATLTQANTIEIVTVGTADYIQFSYVLHNADLGTMVDTAIGADPAPAATTGDADFYGNGALTGADGLQQSFVNPTDGRVQFTYDEEGGDGTMAGDDGIVMSNGGTGVEQTYTNTEDGYEASNNSPVAGSATTGDQNYNGDAALSGASGLTQDYANPTNGYDATSGSPREGEVTGGDNDLSGVDGGYYTQDGFYVDSATGNPGMPDRFVYDLAGLTAGAIVTAGTIVVSNGLSASTLTYDGEADLGSFVDTLASVAFVDTVEIDADGQIVITTTGSGSYFDLSLNLTFDDSSTLVDDLRAYGTSVVDVTDGAVGEAETNAVDTDTDGDDLDVSTTVSAFNAYSDDADMLELTGGNASPDTVNNFQPGIDKIGIEDDLAATTLVDAAEVVVDWGEFDLSTIEFGLVSSANSGLAGPDLEDATQIAALLNDVFGFTNATTDNGALNSTIFAVNSSDGTETAIWAHTQSGADDNTVDTLELNLLATVSTRDGEFEATDFAIWTGAGFEEPEILATPV